MNLTQLISETAAATGEVSGATTAMGLVSMILPIALMILVFWLLVIRPERKRSKEMQEMLDNLQVADEVVTNGGIVGLVVSIQKDTGTVLIETSGDRTKIRVMRSAIAKCNTEHESAPSAVEKPKKKSNGKTEIK